MMNRCDSVDALMYAYCEYMRMKENRMLEKDKKCIEFSMHSMTATHKPYQENTEIAITGMAPGKSLLFAINPFDIPCDVIVVPKRYFERLQIENERLQKKIDELHDDISGRSTVIEHDKREIERLRGVLRRSNSVMLKTLEQEIDTWQKATGCNTPEEAEKKIKLLVDDINVLMRVTED